MPSSDFSRLRYPCHQTLSLSRDWIVVGIISRVPAVTRRNAISLRLEYTD